MIDEQNKWFRCRFYVEDEDYRPVKWPPPGPYWCTGYDSDDNAVLVAYVRRKDQVEEYWPGYIEDSYEMVDEIVYTSRFPKPDWYRGRADQ